MTSMEIIQFSRPPTPLFIYVQKSSNLLILDVQFQMKPPSPNENQSIQIKHNPRMTLICRQVLPSAFVFSINSLISSSFHLTFLHLAEASLSALSWLYTPVCKVVQKYHEMYFTYNHFQYSFCNQPAFPRDFEILDWCPVGSVLSHGEKVPLQPWFSTLLVMVSR